MGTIEAGGNVIVAGEIGTVNLQGKPLPIGGGPNRASLNAVAGFAGGSAAIATIRCQEFIIRQYTGISLSENFLIDEARANGWYNDDRGTRPSDIGKLLELHGIPVRRYTDASSRQLATELGSGHRIIVGAESHDGWNQNPILADIHHRLGLGTSDPIVVSRVDPGEPGPENVVVIAPGMGGAAAHYPMEQFLGAWNEHGFFMVAAQGPPPFELMLHEMRSLENDSGGLGDPEQPLAIPLESDFQESYLPLAYDLDDPFCVDHEDQSFNADCDVLGDDGGDDFG